MIISTRTMSDRQLTGVFAIHINVLVLRILTLLSQTNRTNSGMLTLSSRFLPVKASHKRPIVSRVHLRY